MIKESSNVSNMSSNNSPSPNLRMFKSNINTECQENRFDYFSVVAVTIRHTCYANCVTSAIKNADKNASADYAIASKNGILPVTRFSDLRNSRQDASKNGILPVTQFASDAIRVRGAFFTIAPPWHRRDPPCHGVMTLLAMAS